MIILCGRIVTTTYKNFMSTEIYVVLSNGMVRVLQLMYLKQVPYVVGYTFD